MAPVIGMAIKALLTRIAVSLISEKFLDWAFFRIAEEIVKSTQNPHDDEWLAMIKDQYYGSKE